MLDEWSPAEMMKISKDPKTVTNALSARRVVIKLDIVVSDLFSVGLRRGRMQWTADCKIPGTP